MNRKARILHVIDNTDPGGAQSQLVSIFKSLKDEYDLSVAVLGRRGRLEEVYRSLGIAVHPLQQGSSRWSPGSFLPLLRLIHQMQPQLVHAHLFKSNILASLAAWLAGVPCLLHDHSGMDADGLKFYFPNAISRFLYSSAYLIALKVSASVLVLTPQMRTATLHHYHLPPAKVTVLPNAIDLERSISGMEVRQSLRDELELSASSQLIVMVGRMAPEKDWSTFIEIASYFTVRHQYAFLAVGSGKMELELRKLVHDKGLENFQFLGDRQDVASILTQSEVLVLTSRQEAFGIVLLEAMAVGCPVIAARAAGPIVIIQNGVNGLLVEIRDVTGFVNAINQVLSDPELAGRLAENAHRSVRQYDVNTVVQQLSNTYSSLLHEPGDPL